MPCARCTPRSRSPREDAPLAQFGERAAEVAASLARIGARG